MELRLLGPVVASVDGVEVALGGPKPRAILARLALARGRVVPTGSLIDGVWGGSDEVDRTPTLQAHISGIRKALREAGSAAVIEHLGGGYRVELTGCGLDVERFESTVYQASAAWDEDRYDAAAALYRMALSEWTGDVALEGLHDAPFAEVERAALGRRRDEAFERRVEADLAVGRVASLTSELELHLGRARYREPGWALLARCAYATSGSAAALDAIRRARRVLVDELGLDPGPELIELEQRVLAHEPSLRTVQPVRVRSRPPRPASALIGRDADTQRLWGALEDPAACLVTITGPGGVGKTSLAVDAAFRWAQAGREVAFISLEPVGSSDDVAVFVAGELGRDPAVAEGAPDELIVLDNAEHVVDAGPIIAEMAARSTARAWLVTSRTALRVRSETEVRLDPLPFDLAAECFLAALARAGVEPDDLDRAVFTALCRQLDGLPFAIELVAGAARHRPLADVLHHLDEVLGERTGAADAPERHRSVGAAVRWSTNLLSEAERSVLSAVSVFSETFDVEDAVALIGDDSVRRIVRSLADSSLLSRGEHGVGSYRMFAPVRAFVESELTPAARAAWTERLAEQSVELGERLARADGSARIDAYDQLDKRLLDLTAALRSPTVDPERIVGVIAALDDFWVDRGHTQVALGLLDAVAQGGLRGGGAATVSAQLLRMRWFNLEPITVSEVEAAISACHEAGLDEWIAKVARVGSDVVAGLGENPDHYVEVAIAAGLRSEGPSAVHGLLARCTGVWHASPPDVARARRYGTEALEVARRVGGPREIALCCAVLADIEMWELDPASDGSVVAALVDEAVRAAVVSGSRYAEFVASTCRIDWLVRQRRFDEARVVGLQVLVGAKRLDLRAGIVVGLVQMAIVDAAVGESERAAFVLGAVDDVLASGGVLSPVGERDLVAAWRQISQELGDAAESISAAGRAAGIQSAVAVAEGGPLPSSASMIGTPTGG